MKYKVSPGQNGADWAVNNSPYAWKHIWMAKGGLGQDLATQNQVRAALGTPNDYTTADNCTPGLPRSTHSWFVLELQHQPESAPTDKYLGFRDQMTVVFVRDQR